MHYSVLSFFVGELSKLKLHWWVFPFHIKHPSSMGVVGLIPIGNGPLFSTAELQVY